MLASYLFTLYHCYKSNNHGAYMPFSVPNAQPLSGRVRVNIRTAINSSSIRREKRNGRDMIIVPSATLPDNVIMNNIMYPASEIAKSFQTLERTFAPLGHPMVGNNYVSAREPEAINGYHVGAWNENVRRENGRVFLDKVIDTEVAMRTEQGKALIDAINTGKPINTSTGVFLNVKDSGVSDYGYVAEDLYFDHDAILLDEEGAATPSQGVGMMVNKNGEQMHAIVNGKQVTAINSMLDCYDDSVEWAAKNLFDAIESRDRAGRAQGFIDKLMAMLGFTSEDSSKQQASGLNNNGKEETSMPISDEQFKALSDKVDALTANAENIAKDMAANVEKAIAPLTEALTKLQANANQAEETERTDLVSKVVANKLLDEETAKGLAINALRQLAEKSVVNSAAPLVAGSYQPNSQDDQWKGYDLTVKEDK